MSPLATLLCEVLLATPLDTLPCEVLLANLLSSGTANAIPASLSPPVGESPVALQIKKSYHQSEPSLKLKAQKMHIANFVNMADPDEAAHNELP